MEVASAKFVSDVNEGVGSELNSCPSHSVTPCNNPNIYTRPNLNSISLSLPPSRSVNKTHPLLLLVVLQ